MTGDESKRIRQGQAGWFGLVALATVIAITLRYAAQPSAVTRSTIHLALVEYALASWLMMGMSPDDWRAVTSRGRSVRWLWTWAWLTFLVHVACAFHFTHHWSHGHAFEQTRLESGFGEGLYVNYFFMAVWTADVLWWWMSPDRYAGRSRWIDRVLHAFLLFMAFNATVVFEQGPVRVAGFVATFSLAMRWFRKSYCQLSNQSNLDPGRDLSA